MPSTSTLSTSNSNSTRAINLRTLGSLGQSHIDIHVKGAGGHGINGRYVTSYSTMDRIDGHISITAPRDTRFDDIDISLQGVSKTFVDRMSSSPPAAGRSVVVTHRFLRLVQPIDETLLPLPRVLPAGRAVTVPFTFVVPNQLLPLACQHKKANPAVAAAHLQLPPSIGDPEVSGFGGSLIDDMAPDMAKVIYSIRARVTVDDRHGFDQVVAERSRKIRIKPVYDEAPPLEVRGNPDYCLRREKAIRKGLLKGKSGTLVMEASQPRSIRVPGARTHGTEGITTAVKTQLRFDPISESQEPPKLGTLSGKMRASTFHATIPRKAFPLRHSPEYDVAEGHYSEVLDLSSRSVASVQWIKRTASGSRAASPPPGPDEESNGSISSRRGSGSSDAVDIPEDIIISPSTEYTGGVFYTASLVVPLTMPFKKNFVPTFHSCFLSRVYSIILSLSVHGGRVASPSLSLKIPVQVSAEGSQTGTANMLERERDAMERREVDHGLIPRSTAPPPVLFDQPLSPLQMQMHMEMEMPDVRQEQQEEAPPDYELSSLTYAPVSVRA